MTETRVKAASDVMPAQQILRWNGVGGSPSDMLT